MSRRELRPLNGQPEPTNSCQTSDSCLQVILDLPLPPIHPKSLYDEMDPWTAASLNEFKSEIEGSETLPVELDSRTSGISNHAGWTPLMYAAYLGQIESTQRLLNLNVDVEQRNSIGQTALILAATCGNEPMIRLLLKYTMIPNIQDHFGRSALHYAILYGQNILIEPLLANGFDPNLPDTEEGMTPMLIACTVGRMSLVDELLKNNGNPRLTNKRGQDGEALASRGDREDVLKRLQWHNKLYSMFEKEDLLKYLPLFETNHISQRKFFELTPQKLSAMGITLLGPQKKIGSLQKQLQSVIAQKKNSGHRPNDQTSLNSPAVTSTVVNGATQKNGNNQDYRRMASEYAYRLQIMTDQLSHQYALNEKIVNRLKEVREALICQTGKDTHLHSIIQALDESNAKILQVLKQ